MSGADWPSSLHLVGSKALGGAERWVQRFAAALAECGASAAVGVRRGSAVAELHMGGLPVHPLPFWSVWDPISRQAITRLVRAMRPDLVQTYMGRATRLTRLSGARRPLHIARLGGYYKLAPYRHADAWIGNTRGLCDWMIGQGLPAAQVHHIYNFVDRAEAYPAGDIEVLRQRLHLREDTWVMLTLGRLIAVKGHGCLLDALARLPAHIGGRPWCLVLVGEGPLRAALEHQAMALGIAERPGLGRLAAGAGAVSPTGGSGGVSIARCRNPGQCDSGSLGLAARAADHAFSRCPRDRAPRRRCLVRCLR
jgi:glycosyltransferase involved in cell wall biosynthesis